MIYLFIDQEYDCPTNELISMAIVGSDGSEFYEVLEDAVVTDPWVMENVMPVLNKEGVTRSEFQEKLRKYIDHFKGKDITIVADWPDDIAYFCRAILTRPGETFINKRRINFLLDRNISAGKSKIPHNALEDARAIKESFGEL